MKQEVPKGVKWGPQLGFRGRRENPSFLLWEAKADRQRRKFPQQTEVSLRPNQRAINLVTRSARRSVPVTHHNAPSDAKEGMPKTRVIVTDKVVRT